MTASGAAPVASSRYELLAAIAEFHAAYAQCIDDDQLEYWPGFFVEHCLYRIIPRENADRELPAAIMYCDSKGMLVDRIVALRKANIYPAHYSRHIIGTPLLQHTNGEIIRAQTNYVVLQTREGETRIFNAGKYVDEMTWVDGALKLRQRSCVFDTHQIDTLLVTPI